MSIRLSMNWLEAGIKWRLHLFYIAFDLNSIKILFYRYETFIIDKEIILVSLMNNGIREWKNWFKDLNIFVKL